MNPRIGRGVGIGAGASVSKVILGEAISEGISASIAVGKDRSMTATAAGSIVTNVKIEDCCSKLQ